MREERIKEFFEGAEKLLMEYELDKRSLDNFFSNLRFRMDIFQQTKKQTDVYLASDFNVFDYIYPDENQISDIIRDLLDPEGKHGQGDLFFKEFLNLIGKSEIYTTQKVNLIRENPTTYILKSQRRIDITIDFDDKYGIGIENKPWAAEQEDQLKDYREHLKKKYKDNYFLIYLSGSESPPMSIEQGEREALEREGKFITLFYPFEFKNWLELCYKECKAEKIRLFLRDFIDYVEKNFRVEYME